MNSVHTDSDLWVYHYAIYSSSTGSGESQHTNTHFVHKALLIRSKTVLKIKDSISQTSSNKCDGAHQFSYFHQIPCADPNQQ